MTAKVIQLAAYRPCTTCGGTKGVHSKVCPKREPPSESWVSWGCPCKTLDEHIEHVNHLIRGYEAARKNREKTWAGLRELADKLKGPDR